MGISQYEVARLTGMTQGSFTNYERGLYEFRLSDAKAVADLLDLTLDEFYKKLTTIEEW